MLELCRWNVADRLQEASGVQPIDPGQGHELDLLDVAILKEAAKGNF
jgi:hypothetical protein